MIEKKEKNILRTLKLVSYIMGSDAVCGNNFYEEDGSVMNNYYPNETNNSNNNTEENDLSNWEQENLQRIQNENNQRTSQEQQHQRYETMQQASHLKTHNERTKSYHHTTTAAPARHQPKHLVVPQWNIPANLSSSYQRLYHDNHYGVAITAPPHLQHQPSITSVPTSSLPAHHGELQTFVHQTPPNHSTPNPKRYQHQGLLSFPILYSHTLLLHLASITQHTKKNMLIHVFMRTSLIWCPYFFGSLLEFLNLVEF